MLAILQYLPEMIIALLIIIGAIIYVIEFVKSSPEEKKAMIGTILLALALKAEQEYGSKTGQAKKAQVIAWFYERYPGLTYVLSKEQLGEYLDEIVEEMTEWLKNNPTAQLNILGKVPESLQGKVVYSEDLGGVVLLTNTEGTVISNDINIIPDTE